MTPRQRHGILVFSAALVLRLASFAVFPTQQALDGDQVDYDRIGWHLATGRGFAWNPGVETSIRAPAYPFLVAAVYKAAGRSYGAVRAVQAVLDAATAWLLFAVCLALFDPRAAAGAAWLCACYPVFIHYDGRIQAETLMTFLTLLSVPGLAAFARGGGLAPLASSSVVLGLATLTRPGTLLMPFFAAPLLALKRPFDWKAPVLYLGLFGAVLLPWQARNHRLFGHWTLCSRGPGFGLMVTGLQTEGVPYEEGFRRYVALAAEPRYQEPTEPVHGTHPYMELEKRMQSEGKAAIKAHPTAYLRIVLGRLPRFWITSHSSVFGVDRSLSEYRAEGRWGPIVFRLALLVFHGGLWALALFGAWAHRSRWRELWPLGLLPVYFTIHIAFDNVPRYHVPALTAVFAFAAAGAVALFDGLRAGRTDS